MYNISRESGRGGYHEVLSTPCLNWAQNCSLTPDLPLAYGAPADADILTDGRGERPVALHTIDCQENGPRVKCPRK